jgi:nifR3 family TIM-barrel protein
MTLQIGNIVLENRLFVAPMAGVTDRPFRMLCRELGAGYAVSEMVTSRKELWNSLKTSRRANHEGEPGPIAVQIAGTDAAMMAEAAQYNIERGAQIIDINMGCPAKKVCNKWAGSALMRDEPLALEIVDAVVRAAAPHDVPVTLKMRTGWDEDHRNAVALARRFENAGVRMLTVHGRTREQGYKGEAEYATIAAVKSAVRVPVVANGDIDSPEKARDVLALTGADALMVGRAGAALDLSRDRALPRDRHASRTAAGGRGAAPVARSPAAALRAVRRLQRRAHRAQAYRLVRARPAGRRALPQRDECHRGLRGAVARGRGLLRCAGGADGPHSARRRRQHASAQR